MTRAPQPARLDAVRLPDGARALVLAPHPDDFDAIGVTMRVLQGKGCEIHLAVATTGASGVEDAFCSPPTAEAKTALREREQRESCRLFGLPEHRLRFLRLAEDEAGHPIADAANVDSIRQVLEEVVPTVVFLPHGHDTNVGHQRVYAMLGDAAREAHSGHAAPGAGSPLLAFLNRDPKTIAMRYDIVTPYGEDDAAWKAALLRAHASQHQRNLRTRGHGFDERILGMDRDTAAACGVGAPYAEVFEVEAFGDRSGRVDTSGLLP